MSPSLPIYLDHSASTPVHPRVFEAMRPYFTGVFANPSSTHAPGRAAAAACLKARNQVAALINAERDEQAGSPEIVFTGGATEANNLALKGALDANRDRGRHVITQVTEHKSVIDACKRLKQHGCEVTWLPVDRGGRVPARQVAEAIRPDTALVSVMWANNETGVINPVREIAAACRERGVLFHTDATQAVGKLPVDVREAGVDLLSLSGHKFYGPKGCGALFVRDGAPPVRLTPLCDGGGHEWGLRSGTLNVPGIVGLGVACDLAAADMEAEARRLSALRDRLEAALLRAGGVSVNGDSSHRLPGVANVSFAGVAGFVLADLFDDVAVSSGSACNSGSGEASYVLRAMGVPTDLALSSIRFSLGRSTTAEEVDYVIHKVTAALPRLRGPARTLAGASR